MLYEDFDGLRRSWEHEGEGIQAFAFGLTDGFLGGTIRYVNNAGKTYEDPVRLLVAHLFNHQTHTAARSTTCSPRPPYPRLSQACTAS